MTAPHVAPTGRRSSFSRSGPVRARVPAAFTLLCALSACTRLSGSADGLDEFRDALASVPGVAPRLSVATEFRPCTEHSSPSGTITVADCPAPRESKPTRFPTIRGNADDPHSLHLLALVDLVTPDPRGKALDRSITALRRVAELTGDSAPALADLSAALIVRAERTQAPRDLLEAYEIAEQAATRDPHYAAALYNRALAIDRFGLVDETASAWQAYLTVDSTSAWATEARRRIRAIRALQQPLHRPPPGAPLPAYAAYAAADPQGARELGMDRILAQWGASVEAGDAARAEDALRRAEALGTALERRPGGDRSLADAVRAIHAAAAAPPAIALLAKAHRAFGEARTLYDSAAYERADTAFAKVIANAGSSIPLRGWARVYGSTVFAHLHPPAQGVTVLDETVEAIDEERYPAMAARVLWSFGNTLNRAERWERGLQQAQSSALLFSQAREYENEGAVLAVIADARSVLGEPDSAYAVIHRALLRLRPYRASLRLHNLLASTSDKAVLDGLPRAALRIEDEDVRVGTRHSPMYAAEALLRRARLRASLGQGEPASHDVETARPLVKSVGQPLIRKWLHADLHEAEATSVFRSDPQRKSIALDSAAAFFAALPFRLLPELVGAAEARLAAGDADDATKRLEIVMRLLEQRRDSIGMEPRRAAVFDAAQGVVDQLVMLKLREGHASEALSYMDRARASLAPTGHASAPSGAGDLRSRPGEVMVEYALVGDTLIAWTVVDRNVEVMRTNIDPLDLARTTEGLEAELERGATEAEVRTKLTWLHERLIRPIEERLGSAETPLVLVVDGALAAVPFSALFDARRGRYLVEDHPLRFAVSLREARRPPPPARVGRALFVADPAFDPRENPLLDRLQHARAEVSRLAQDYPNATVLDGVGATRSAVIEELPRAGVVHLAGHAVFDDARPERSYLVLAPDGEDRAGRLTAADLVHSNLRSVRLVVLSACKTIRGGRTRAAGYTGLSGALLAAGAGGTVGSLWDVDDRSAAALMTEFHQAYSRSTDASSALRHAQLTLLRSDSSSLRSPAAWAAFRYSGR